MNLTPLFSLSFFDSLIAFSQELLHTYNPLLYDRYKQHQDVLHAHEPHLRRNFPNSVWSSLMVNCGPQSTTDPHVDGANVPDGWCPILGLGNYNFRVLISKT
ncbi:hypothetical protein BT96DRAFT_829506 [Gymnopus androsaceus JB14]|uniref:Uncharacterized protein n=1 Tax=Gymnopus androsaceus JB14 TaxID=1447944 RepID=A0A6A4H6C7_9AGAR|nr:hypothetical protein BT96DRAFT_829506 [Gymnopus androsaceus JB14]